MYNKQIYNTSAKISERTLPVFSSNDQLFQHTTMDQSYRTLHEDEVQYSSSSPQIKDNLQYD